jgi:hypothetical protein
MGCQPAYIAPGPAGGPAKFLFASTGSAARVRRDRSVAACCSRSFVLNLPLERIACVHNKTYVKTFDLEAQNQKSTIRILPVEHIFGAFVVLLKYNRPLHSTPLPFLFHQLLCTLSVPLPTLLSLAIISPKLPVTTSVKESLTEKGRPPS